MEEESEEAESQCGRRRRPDSPSGYGQKPVGLRDGHPSALPGHSNQ